MSIDFDSPRVKRLVLWPVLLLFNALGLLLVYTAINQYAAAWSSRSWPTAQGKILSVQVVEYQLPLEVRDTNGT